ATVSFACTACGALALLALETSARTTWLGVYAILFGLGFGARGPIITAMASDLFGGRRFGAIYGVLNLGNGLGAALGPWFASFLPFREAVTTRLRQEDFTDVNLVIDELSLVHGATLQRQSVYLVPLLESLSLPRSIRGKCNPKSTTGRLDVFTRVITDKSARFDEIREGYKGQLYLEVSPQSFPIRVQVGASLNQLRLFSGQATVSDSALE